MKSKKEVAMKALAIVAVLVACSVLVGCASTGGAMRHSKSYMS
ncbi:hypothetical protein NUS68_07080 [Glaesserella parasuis]|nr:hypothetical protein [Glaesserella parasuis]